MNNLGYFIFFQFDDGACKLAITVIKLKDWFILATTGCIKERGHMLEKKEKQVY